MIGGVIAFFLRMFGEDTIDNGVVGGELRHRCRWTQYRKEWRASPKDHKKTPNDCSFGVLWRRKV